MTQRTATGLVPAGDPEPAGRAGEGAPLAEPLGAPLAEAAVLGCLLQTTPAHARQVLARLIEQDWTVPQHAHVAQAIGVLLERALPVDPVTVLGQLRRHGLDNAHTAYRDAGVLLLELCQTAPTIAHASHYTRIVLEHSYRRRIQTAALRLLRAAEHASLDALTDLITAEHEGVTAEQRRRRSPRRFPDPVSANTGPWQFRAINVDRERITRRHVVGVFRADREADQYRRGVSWATICRTLALVPLTSAAVCRGCAPRDRGL